MSLPDLIRPALLRNLFPPDPLTDRQMARRAYFIALRRHGEALRLMPSPNAAPQGQRAFDPLLDPLPDNSTD